MNTTAMAVCIGCACDDNHACIDGLDEPCHWVRLDRETGLGVCSACPGSDVSRWDAGDRDVRALSTLFGNWQHFERVDISPAAPKIQRDALRIAFGSGAASMLALCAKLLGKPTAKKGLIELHAELKKFKP